MRKKNNLSFAQTALRFDVGITSIVRWSKTLHPRTTRNKPSPKIKLEDMKKDIHKIPESYQYERAQRFSASKSGIQCALQRLKFSYKKNSFSSQNRP